MARNPKEYEKFKDEAVRDRELVAAMGRLHLAQAVAFLGPLAIIVMKVLDYTPPKNLMYAVLATAPLGIVILAINYFRLPPDAMGSKPALTVLILTIIAGAATLVLSHRFSMLPL